MGSNLDNGYLLEMAYAGEIWVPTWINVYILEMAYAGEIWVATFINGYFLEMTYDGESFYPQHLNIVKVYIFTIHIFFTLKETLKEFLMYF